MITKKEILSGIKEDLNLDLNEAYVAQEKKYNINTERLLKDTKEAHFSLYRRHIKSLNITSAELDTVDRDQSNPRSSAFRSLKKSEIASRNSVHLHELYFSNIGDPRSLISFDMVTYMKLTRDFGTFNEWQWDFIACADATQSGWAVCAYDMYLRRYINFFIESNDCSIPVSCYPVIVLDVWEHAYFNDYQNDKDKYISDMMQEFNWNVIENRFQRAELVQKAMEAQ